MIKTNTTPETDKLITELVEKELLRYTVQFFHKTDEGLQPFGSGVLALVHEIPFLLTASHIADYFAQPNADLYIRVDTKTYINVIGEIKYTNRSNSNGVDLAYIKLDPQMIEPLIGTFWFLKTEKFSKHNQKLDGTNYCIVGFRADKVDYSKGYMDTGASFYLTSAANDKPYKYLKLNDEESLILTMKGKGTDMFTDEETKIDPEFYGLSGCGAWFINLYFNQETSQYSVDFRLVGIMTEFGSVN